MRTRDKAKVAIGAPLCLAGSTAYVSLIGASPSTNIALWSFAVLASGAAFLGGTILFASGLPLRRRRR